MGRRDGLTSRRKFFRPCRRFLSATRSPFGSGIDALAPVDVASPDKALIETHVTLDLADKEKAGVHFRVHTIYREREADRFRSDQASSSLPHLQQNVLDFYHKRYPGLRVAAPIALHDNFDGNEIELTESYVLPPKAFSAGGLDKQFPVQADTLFNFLRLRKPTVGARPVAACLPFLSAPIRSTSFIAGYALRPPAAFSKATNTASFVLTTKGLDDGMHLDFAVRTFVREVPVKDLAPYLEIARELDNTNSLAYDLSEASALAEPSTPDDKRAEILVAVIIGGPVIGYALYILWWAAFVGPRRKAGALAASQQPPRATTEKPPL